MTSEPKTSQKNPARDRLCPAPPPEPLSETSSAPESEATPATKARWQETRGLLQQALAEWEKSEQLAIEVLKDAETERDQLETLLRKLKAKLEELS